VDNVATGVRREEILRNYAALANPDIDAALAFAAGLMREGTLDLPLEITASSSKSKRIFQQNTRRSRQALHTCRAKVTIWRPRISSKNHSGKGQKSEKLPKDLETFVQAEFLIASHHRNLFRQSLGDDLTVEGIRVQEWQIEKRECMVRSVRQYA
jgi:hypothetical protein